MKIVSDPNLQINIHPFIAYIFLTEEQNEKYAEAINKLNNYKGFTRGIFKFHVVSNNPNEDFYVDDIEDKKNGFNMIVRILDNSSDVISYVTHFLDFDRSVDLVEIDFKKVIDKVCKENAKRLALQLENISEEGDSKLIKGMIQTMLKRFKKSALLKELDQGVWNYLLGGSNNAISSKLFFTSSNKDDNATQEAIDFLKGQIPDKSDYELGLIADKLSELNAIPTLPTTEESDHHVYFVKQIKLYDYPEPERKPNIKVEIKQLKYLYHKKEIDKIGIEINVNGESFPIIIKDSDPLVLLLSTLLRNRLGTKFYEWELTGNKNGKKLDFPQEWLEKEANKTPKPKTLEWIKCIYNETHGRKFFEDWLSKYREEKPNDKKDEDKDKSTNPKTKYDAMHYLNQAISAANKAIVSKLKKNTAGCLHYCLIQHIGGYYTTRLAPEDIIIPSSGKWSQYLEIINNNFPKVKNEG